MGTYIQHKLDKVLSEHELDNFDIPLPDDDEYGISYTLTGEKTKIDHRAASFFGSPNVTYSSIPHDYDANETEIGIAYDYQPEEPRTYDYPGSDASIDVYEVWIEPSKEIIMITNDEVGAKLLGELEQMAWEDLQTQHERYEP